MCFYPHRTESWRTDALSLSYTTTLLRKETLCTKTTETSVLQNAIQFNREMLIAKYHLTRYHDNKMCF